MTDNSDTHIHTTEWSRLMRTVDFCQMTTCFFGLFFAFNCWTGCGPPTLSEGWCHILRTDCSECVVVYDTYQRNALYHLSETISLEVTFWLVLIPSMVCYDVVLWFRLYCTCKRSVCVCSCTWVQVRGLVGQVGSNISMKVLTKVQ